MKKDFSGALLAKTEQLKIMNSNFVWREIKMMELKREINELLLKQGEKAKYIIHHSKQ